MFSRNDCPCSVFICSVVPYLCFILIFCTYFELAFPNLLPSLSGEHVDYLLKISRHIYTVCFLPLAQQQCLHVSSPPQSCFLLRNTSPLKTVTSARIGVMILGLSMICIDNLPVGQKHMGSKSSQGAQNVFSS